MNACLILSIKDLEEMPLSWWKQERYEIREKLKRVSGCQWDNQAVMIDAPRGGLYSIAVEYHTVPAEGFDVYLWDVTGGRCLESFQFFSQPSKTMPKAAIDKLVSAMNLDHLGGVRCSGCGRAILKKDIAGTFYASQYCSECWELEWKEKAANENYD